MLLFHSRYHFIEHQKFLAMKAKKRATERNKLPDINWSDEVEVNSLSASKLKLYLKEHGLPVSGGKAALVARVLGAGEAQGKENPDEQQSSSSEDQEDNEQSDDSEIDDYEEQSFEVLFILTTQWNALQYGE